MGLEHPLVARVGAVEVALGSASTGRRAPAQVAPIVPPHVTIPSHKAAEIASRTSGFMAHEASKPFGWSSLHFLQWATVETMIKALGIPQGASIMDVGCGSGWTSLFLAEAGFQVIGYDLVPANVELATTRATRWGSSARFQVSDMESLPSGEQVDAALVLDALHHTGKQRQTLVEISRRLRPGGWLMVGEPTWLHKLSPKARRVGRDLGWLERGIALRGLRRDLAYAGFDEVRRFYQPTWTYEKRVRGLAWELVRLIAANVFVAPQSLLWIAARRRDADDHPQ